MVVFGPSDFSPVVKPIFLKAPGYPSIHRKGRHAVKMICNKKQNGCSRMAKGAEKGIIVRGREAREEESATEVVHANVKVVASSDEATIAKTNAVDGG